MSGLLWALIALPLAGGSLLAVAGRRANAIAAAAGVGLAAATLALAVAAVVAQPAAQAAFLAELPMGSRRSSFPRPRQSRCWCWCLPPVSCARTRGGRASSG